MISSEPSLHYFIDLLDNAVLAWGLAACGLAQFLKIFFELIQNRRWRPLILFETGGMPSSHSALITGVAAGVGIQEGFSDPLFALAGTIAFIVMYDASGVRHSAGLIANKVNKLSALSTSDAFDKPLKENLGHTRAEVLVGSVLGPAVALPGIVYIGSPLDLLEMIGLISV